MASLSQDEFIEAVNGFADSSLHLEMRDSYGTEVELPRMAAWVAGEPDDYAWLAPYCADLKTWAGAGKSVRRARIVSEPLSTYRRWSYGNATVMVDAGEDIRWVPRRLVSSIALPGNDFFLLDHRLVIFLHYAGNGLNSAYTSSTDPHDLTLCAAAFEAVWTLGVPHREYQPS
jgi:hypothetical protein